MSREPAGRRLRHPRDESGFTLIETMVAITLLGIIMTATTSFFISANRSTSDLRHKQLGIQLIDDALEQANSIDPNNLILKRDTLSEAVQWKSATLAGAWSAVGPWLVNTNEVSDPAVLDNVGKSCATTGDISVLCVPTVPIPHLLDGITYQVNTFIGQCWKLTTATATDCVATKPASGGISFYRVVAAASWHGKSCPSSNCSYISAQLQNTGYDAIFNLNKIAAAPLPLQIFTPAPQVDTVGGTVQLTVAASGGSGTYEWQVVGGLPNGLSFDPTSHSFYLSPTKIGTSTVTVKATDSVNSTKTTSFSWTINPAATVTATDADLTTGKPGTVALTATAGSPPYTWSAAGLPNGLSIATGASAITGTPTDPTAKPGPGKAVVVTATDKDNVKSNTTIYLTVHPAPTVAALPDVSSTVGTPKTVTAAGNEGTTPYAWSMTGAPAGIAIATGTGAISGTANSPGSYSVTVTLTDRWGATASTPFTWTVNPTPSVTRTFLTTTLTQGQTVSVDLVGTGGSATAGKPYLWSATGLPPGLSIASGASAITGTLTTPGSYTTTVSLTDNNGVQASKTSTLTVLAAPAVSPAVASTGTTVGQPFSLALTGTGGNYSAAKPYVWNATGLPAGLTLTAGSATIAGTPTSAGSYPVTVTMTDNDGAAASKTITLNVNPRPSIAAIANQTSTQGKAGSFTVTATDGTPPYGWSITGAPAGTSIAATTGVISGTPTTTGSYLPTVTVTDSAGARSTMSFTWTVLAPLVVTTTAATTWPSEPASVQLQQTGGVDPVTWSTPPSGQPGALPAGLTLDTATGLVTGTPTSVGITTVNATATDTAGRTSTQPIAWTVKLRTGQVLDTAGLCLDVYGAGNAVGTTVGSYSCNNGGNQRWTFAADHTLQVTVSGLTRCLNAAGATAGSATQLAACDPTAASQRWVVSRSGATTVLVNQQPGLQCLDEPTAGGVSPLDIQPCQFVARRTWQLPS